MPLAALRRVVPQHTLLRSSLDSRPWTNDESVGGARSSVGHCEGTMVAAGSAGAPLMGAAVPAVGVASAGMLGSCEVVEPMAAMAADCDAQPSRR